MICVHQLPVFLWWDELTLQCGWQNFIVERPCSSVQNNSFLGNKDEAVKKWDHCKCQLLLWVSVAFSSVASTCTLKELRTLHRVLQCKQSLPQLERECLQLKQTVVRLLCSPQQSHSLMVLLNPWSEIKLNLNLNLNLLFCSHAGGSQLEVKLVLLWKHNMRIEYLAVTPWPLDPSKRSTWVEVTMEGSYDILHDISCTMRKPITSLYRTTVIRRFWNTLQRWAGPCPAVPRVTK